MYLKSLTLRGFKSFASSTTLHLEPGITCVVGPNGSGKSNVVDALAWVMGEQGAKSLRGGKMEDVVFAGTAARAPLGRAEVVLTIDNTDGALPIDYTEVTISRTMFRSGGSEYAMNGQPCRLLDVQELLADSGIGREMHVVVGQGRLEAILHATPEERRGFVEEAAGVLKHRRRKEKAVRKLDATDANLTRLADLLTEIRRQLKPLGRQAEVAKHAAVVQMAARDARARLLADDVVTGRAALERETADDEELRRRRTAAEEAIEAGRAREKDLEEAVAAVTPRLATAQETWFALARLRDRFTAVGSLAAERRRRMTEEPLPERFGRDPEELEAEAADLRRREQEIATELASRRQALDRAAQARQQAEAAHAEEDRRVAALLRAVADRREGRATLAGRVDSLRSRSNAAEDEIARLQSARDEAQARADRAQRDFTALETTVAGLDAGERGLDAEYEAACGVLHDLDDRLAKLREQLQASERERAGLAARRDALELGLVRKDGAGALAASADQLSGVLGPVARLITVRSGYEAAVAGALGRAAESVAVAGLDAAIASIEHLKRTDLGRADLLVGAEDATTAAVGSAPAGSTYVLDLLDAPAALAAALHALLGSTVVVEDLSAARRLVLEHPALTAVTRAGDVLGVRTAAGGSASQPSPIEIQAAVEEAMAAFEDATAATERLRFELAGLEQDRRAAQRRVDVALAKLHESDAALAAVAEELGQFGAAVRSGRAECERIDAAIAAARRARDDDVAGLAELEQRLAGFDDAVDEEPDTSTVQDLAAAVHSARDGELAALLAVRTAEERAQALHGRADALTAAAEAERAARQQARAHRERVLREGRTAAAVETAVSHILERLDVSLAVATERREAVERDRATHQAALLSLREQQRAVEAELATLTDTVHRDEMMRAEHRLRMEQLEQRAMDELGLDLESLVAEFGPHQPVPVPAAADSEEVDRAEPAVAPYDRREQERRLRSSERALAELGRINPLALEEFGALEERHAFLSGQLEDLRRTRRDLLDIVKEVDQRVQEVFAAAYVDVAREFSAVFARLFPGGEGRLTLTDLDDMLTTGIEVEAKPAGKRVKRLSLLSGGERSLVAVAFLVALFKARPSPFYVLDEVEAALDDANIGRLLGIFDELRDTSQLVVITHQKRTMEVADALYGVSMRGDGVSAVISQRLRERESA